MFGLAIFWCETSFLASLLQLQDLSYKIVYSMFKIRTETQNLF